MNLFKRIKLWEYENFYAHDMRLAYQTAMDILFQFERISWGDGGYVKTSRSDIIRFFMQTLKINLFGSDLTRILFASEAQIRTFNDNFIPRFPLPQNHTIERRVNMPVGDNTVVSAPWSKSRWGGAMRHLAHGDFNYSLSYYSGDFFPELQLIRVRNGRHHLALAKLKNQGAIDVNVYPLTLCFPYFKTDGAYWIDKRSGKKEPVHEIRFAILYGLARELWKEENR